MNWQYFIHFLSILIDFNYFGKLIDFDYLFNYFGKLIGFNYFGKLIDFNYSLTHLSSAEASLTEVQSFAGSAL